jgi:hypothetical protein
MLRCEIIGRVGCILSVDFDKKKNAVGLEEDVEGSEEKRDLAARKT